MKGIEEIHVMDSYLADNMKFALCCSGSKGNCFVLEENDCRLVIDCGSTKRRLEQSFRELGFSVKDVDACLITHHHKDHLSQIKMFNMVDVYSGQVIEGIKKFNLLTPLESFEIKGIKITPIPLSHDAENTLGFVFETKKEKLVYITDTGYINTVYIPLLYDADYIVLESNHDIEMLMNSNRPHFIKSRIYSDNGHLCNEDCAATIEAIITSRTKEIILAHLSEEANTPQRALEVSVNALLNKKEHLHPNLVVMAAVQYEMIQGGSDYEEDSYCSNRCFVGLE